MTTTILSGDKDKILRIIFHTSIGWKCLFHIYRLSHKEKIIHAQMLSKELGHNVSNVRKVLSELEDLNLIKKTKIQKTEVVYISKLELTPFGKEIASHIYGIVKCVFRSPKSSQEQVIEEGETI